MSGAARPEAQDISDEALSKLPEDTQKELKDWWRVRDNERIEMYKTAEKIQANAQKTTTDFDLVASYKDIDNVGDAINYALTAVFEQAPQIPLAATTLGVSTMEQSYGGIMSEVMKPRIDELVARGMPKDGAIEVVLNDPEIDRASAKAASWAMGGLDAVGAGSLLAPFKKKAATEILKSYVKKTGLKGALRGVATEQGTEIAQEMIQKGAVEKAQGGSFIEGVKSMDVDEYIEISLKTLFGAGPSSAIAAYTDKGKITNENVNMLYEAAKNDQVLKNLEEHLAMKKLTGEITEQEYIQKIDQLADDVANVLNS